jgi:hypothetical protein
MPRPPVSPYKIVEAYGALRTAEDVASGKVACGISKGPCHHYAADIQASKGTIVQAPTDGWVLVSQRANGGAPFAGYGPAVVLFAHDDRLNLDPKYKAEDEAFLVAKSQHPELLPDAAAKGMHPLSPDNDRNGGPRVRTAYYSLLAHLDPGTLPYDAPWKRAEGLTDTNDATRYRSRADRSKPGSFTDALRVADWPDWATYVREGQPLGQVGPYGHVHWEVRLAPIGPNVSSGAGEIDPRSWLHSVDPSQDWEGAPPSPKAKQSGNGLGIAIAAGVFIYFSERDRRRR